MIGGTVQIKYSEEQYKRFCDSEAFTTLVDFCKEHAVNLNMEFHSIMGIEWAQADYGTQNSSLTHDESRKDKIDARKEWAKDNTKPIENWRKFYRKAKK